MSDFVIAVDFDGTIVKHEYPKIGEPVPAAIDWLTVYQGMGAKLILWTIRSRLELLAAEAYCSGAGVKFWGVNRNPDQSWSDSQKVYAQVYIDDAAAGCPLIFDSTNQKRPYADWSVIGPSVRGMIESESEPA